MAFRVTHLQEVRERLSIAEVAEKLLTVRNTRNGAPYQCNCPLCHSGEHNDGALTIYADTGTWYCFACGSHGDALDLIGAANGTTSLSDELTLVSELFGIDVSALKAPDLEARARFAYEQKLREIERKRKQAEELERWHKNQAAEANNLNGYLAQIEHPDALAYLATRGIDIKTARRWNLGYNPANKRIVIPYPASTYYHADRDITGRAEHKYLKPSRGYVGPEPLWNPAALNARELVVCEGQFDALAISDIGFCSIACGGTAFKKLIRAIEQRGGYDGKLVLMFDNPSLDRAGALTDTAAAEELKAHDIRPTILENYPSGIKDPFAWWQHDKRAFASAVAKAVAT